MRLFVVIFRIDSNIKVKGKRMKKSPETTLVPKPILCQKRLFSKTGAGLSTGPSFNYDDPPFSTVLIPAGARFPWLPFLPPLAYMGEKLAKTGSSPQFFLSEE